MNDERNRNLIYRCLYCLEDTVSNPAEEHVIPDALGGDLILPKNYCCKRCNDKIGTVEAKLIEMFAFWRVLFDVRSRKNPNREPRMKIFLGSEPDTGLPGYTVPGKIFKLPHPVRINEEKWVFPDEKSKDRVIRNYERKGKGIYFEKQEGTKIGSGVISWKNPEFTHEHSRSLVKIAYSLAAYVIGIEDIVCESFRITRDYINGKNVSVRIAYPDPEYPTASPIDTLGPLGAKSWCGIHSLALMNTRDKRLLAMINICGFHYAVQLSENWQKDVCWLSYLYINPGGTNVRQVMIIPKEDIPRYINTSAIDFAFGTLLPLLSAEDRDRISSACNHLEFIAEFFQIELNLKERS